jgi:hypothetical protein
VLFLEGSARALLLLHAVVGATTVAVTTHLFVWVRKWLRGTRGTTAVRWLAGAGLALYATQFTLGNLIYPVYKVRVRAELLELPSAAVADAEARQRADELVRQRAGAPPPPPAELRGTGPRYARLFDVKEHIAAIGLPLAALALLLVRVRRPEDEPSAAERGLLLWTTGCAAACSWFAGLVGLAVSAARAVG